MRVPLRSRRVQPLLVPLEGRVSGLICCFFGLVWSGLDWDEWVAVGGVRYGVWFDR